TLPFRHSFRRGNRGNIMPNTRPLLSTIVSLFASFMLLGCSETTPTTPAPQPPGTIAPASTSTSSKASETSVTVGFVFGETQKIFNPDPETIEKHLRATDWNNTQQRPMVHVTRTTATGSTTIKLEGTLGTPNDDGPFRAKVIALDTDEKGVYKIVLG